MGKEEGEREFKIGKRRGRGDRKEERGRGREGIGKRRWREDGKEGVFCSDTMVQYSGREKEWGERRIG